MQWSKMTQWPYFGFSFAYVSLYVAPRSLPLCAAVFTASYRSDTNARVPAMPSATCSGPFSAAPRPGTSCVAFSADTRSSVAGQSS